jgi:hypothetical protein
MRTTELDRYAFEPQDLRDRMTALGIRSSWLRQQIMDTAVAVAQEIESLPGTVGGAFRYVDLSLTEIDLTDTRVTLRFYGRPWTDQPAEFLREETLFLD